MVREQSFPKPPTPPDSLWIKSSTPEGEAARIAYIEAMTKSNAFIERMHQIDRMRVRLHNARFSRTLRRRANGLI